MRGVAEWIAQTLPKHFQGAYATLKVRVPVRHRAVNWGPTRYESTGTN